MATFDEIRNNQGVLTRLKFKLSQHKDATVTLVPKTKLPYLHLFDVTQAVKCETGFNKKLTKSYSLSMDEVTTQKSLITGMDGQVRELADSAPIPGSKRKGGNEPAYGKRQQLASRDLTYGSAEQQQQYDEYQRSSSIPAQYTTAPTQQNAQAYQRTPPAKYGYGTVANYQNAQTYQQTPTAQDVNGNIIYQPSAYDGYLQQIAASGEGEYQPSYGEQLNVGQQQQPNTYAGDYTAGTYLPI